MKVRLKELIESISAIQELSTLKFPSLKAFDLAELLDQVQSHCKRYEEIRNQKILENSSNQKSVDEDKVSTFMKDINELLEKEIDLIDFSLEKSDFDGQNISAGQIMLLKWLIK